MLGAVVLEHTRHFLPARDHPQVGEEEHDAEDAVDQIERDVTAHAGALGQDQRQIEEEPDADPERHDHRRDGAELLAP